MEYNYILDASVCYVCMYANSLYVCRSACNFFGTNANFRFISSTAEVFNSNSTVSFRK